MTDITEAVVAGIYVAMVSNVPDELGVQESPRLQTHTLKLLLHGQTLIVEGRARLTGAIAEVLVQPQARVTTTHMHTHTHLMTRLSKFVHSVCHSLSAANVESFRASLDNVGVLSRPLVHRYICCVCC